MFFQILGSIAEFEHRPSCPSATRDAVSPPPEPAVASAGAPNANFAVGWQARLADGRRRPTIHCYLEKGAPSAC